MDWINQEKIKTLVYAIHNCSRKSPKDRTFANIKKSFLSIFTVFFIQNTKIFLYLFKFSLSLASALKFFFLV